MLEPTVKAIKINSIEIWTDAFIVYMSVYCSIDTTNFQALLKYMNSIRLGAKRCSGDGFFSFKLCDTFNEISSLALGID
jgi:CRISPR/Cas system CSM-associated protein Csm4 (group 5 of RAMP superfamily)